MNNIEILELFIKSIRSDLHDDSEDNQETANAIENLIQENKELKEKVKGMYDKSNKLIEVTNLYLNSVPRSKIINLLENEVIDISGFECIPARDLQELLEEGE